MITLIILAVAAALILYQLYAVLGRRVGRQPEDVVESAKPSLSASDADKPPGEREVIQGAALTGLAALRARDPAFDTGRFLAGARTAYETIVIAFSEGDRETLSDLLSPQVMAGFERAMTDRDAQGRSEAVEFLHAPRADVEVIEVEGDIGRVRVRFLAEHRVRSKSDEGEAVEDRRTAELWTFERNLNSRDPNWTLVRVDAAEA